MENGATYTKEMDSASRMLPEVGELLSEILEGQSRSQCTYHATQFSFLIFHLSLPLWGNGMPIFLVFEIELPNIITLTYLAGKILDWSH